MEIAQLIAFNALLLAALLSPGPAMLFAVRGTLAGGRAHGIAIGLGLGTMAAIWTGLALVGLAAILALVPPAYMVLRLLGAAYLIWIAISLWRDAASSVAVAAPVPSLNRAFVSGLLVNAANPKSVVFAASAIVVIFPPDIAVGAKVLIVTNQLLVEWMAYAAFAVLLSTAPARRGYLHLKPVFDRIAAAVLGALGLRLLLDR